ncbi:hypothetical protein [Aquisphaera insulae]|uniref:hypothetical protein n=1 Tax=Aquisphaera insulae TaxID=2712864 RepID=UPI0013EA4FB4|nr:hypothetical protein [Aquisphaera insulae]
MDRTSVVSPASDRACWRPAVLLGAFLAIAGCAPAEVGSIDMARSKAIAAERGIGPGGGGPTVPAGKSKKGASARPSQPGSSPVAPAPR